MLGCTWRAAGFTGSGVTLSSLQASMSLSLLGWHILLQDQHHEVPHSIHTFHTHPEGSCSPFCAWSPADTGNSLDLPCYAALASGFELCFRKLGVYRFSQGSFACLL